MTLINWHDFVSSLLYSIVGVIVFVVSFKVVDWITPYDLWKELIEKKNQPLAIVVGAVGLGICIIIAAAMHG
ncbi:MAG TPA: DUF350 domain-containing protein [Verrucomicrobiaceae bacterium]|jgi:uncharacterized membrane protein YjfL (UPF0719 family)